MNHRTPNTIHIYMLDMSYDYILDSSQFEQNTYLVITMITLPYPPSGNKQRLECVNEMSYLGHFFVFAMIQ
jgi:hypothetical protein